MRRVQKVGEVEKLGKGAHWLLMRKKEIHPIFALLGFLLLNYAVAFAGSLGTLRGLGGWYQVLAKPPWNPPAWLFAPVWTFLYGCIAVAGWLIWKSDQGDRTTAYLAYGLQLVLNLVWPWIFFAYHQLFASSIEIGILAIAIVLNLILFYRLNKWAGLLLAPYFLWVCFASALNFEIWHLSNAPGAVQVVQISGP